MIIWLNGPFGVGKTTVAARLVDRLPHSAMVNPERLGWVLRRTVGAFRPGDYQDLTLWRAGTVRLTSRRARTAGTVVVPMTVLRPDHLDEILGGLRSDGHRVHHVLLDAAPEVLRRRIAAERDDPAAGPWRHRHVETYLAARPDLSRRGPVIATDHLGQDEIADAVATTVA